jgi:hypothetical protein
LALVIATWFLLVAPSLPAARPPPNDFFTNRTAIAVTNLPDPILFTNVSVQSNTGATKEEGEPEHAFNPGGKSVWWTLIAARPRQKRASGSSAT